MSIQKDVMVAIVERRGSVFDRLRSIDEHLEIVQVPPSRSVMRDLYMLQPRVVILAGELTTDEVTGLSQSIRTDPRLPLTRVIAVRGAWTTLEAERIASSAHLVCDNDEAEAILAGVMSSLSASMNHVNRGQRSIRDERIEVIRVGDLTITAGSYCVSTRGVDTDLTAGEFELLWALAQLAGRALTLDEIAKLGDPSSEPPSDRAVRARVAALRRKIRGATARILNVRGIGYRLIP